MKVGCMSVLRLVIDGLMKHNILNSKLFQKLFSIIQ